MEGEALFLRKIACVMLAIAVLNILAGSCSAIGVGARAAILMDVISGVVLYGKNINERLPMASLTKIMTALLAAESGRLDETVTVASEATQVEPSAIWLVPGEKILLRDLVYGLMLRSGNDAALAIAYFLSGSVSAFCAEMNNRAEELGATNTNFMNPHGLSHRDHYTTAHDLALVTRAALTNEFVKGVVATKRFESPWEGHDYPRVWHNKNRLLQLMPQADGVKTGWTQAAGHCLASSATKNGWQLLSIVLDSPSHYEENRALLTWGFYSHRQVDVLTLGAFQGYVSVQRAKPEAVGAVTSQGLKWIAKSGEEPDFEYRVVLPTELELPVYKGMVLGVTYVSLAGKEIARIPLVADQGARDSSWIDRLLRNARNYVEFVHKPLTILV